MPTTATLGLVDRRGHDYESSALVVRTQVAFVRALAHEIDRHHEPGTNVTELYAQLQEEIERLDAMFGDLAPPDWAPSSPTAALDALLWRRNL